MFDNARPSDIIAFLERIDPTVLVGRTPIDAWREFLKKNGGGGSSLNDQEDNWLAAKTATMGKKGDKVGSYMSAKGFSGTTTDKVKAYLKGAATQ